MFKAEWGIFKQQPFLMVVLAGLLILPTVYAVIFLSSLWDPYGEVKNLPVAVVNQDQPVAYNGKTLSVGADLAKNLKKSDAMDFTVMSDQAAEKGVEDGKYYMKITIPQDFSSNATTLLDKQPKQMQLDYELSSGHSFIAGKMSASAASKIITTVSQQVTKTYGQTLVSSLLQLGDGVKTASDANQQLADGTAQIQTGNQTITTNLQTLAAGSLTLRDGTTKLQNGLSTYLAGVETAQAGSQQLATGSQSVTAGMTQYTNGVATAYQGSQTLTAGLAQLDSQAGSAALADKLTQAQTVLTQLEALKTYLPNDQQLATAVTSVTQIVTDLQGLQAAQTADQTTMANNIHALNLSADDEARVLSTIQSTTASSQTTALLSDVQTQVGTITTIVTPILAEKEQFLQAVSQMKGLDATGLSTKLADLKTASDGITQLHNGASALTTGLQQLNDNSAALNSGAAQVATGTGSLNTGLATLVANNGQIASGTSQLTAGASQINNGATQLADGSATLGEALTQVQSGNQTLATKLSDAGAKTSVIKSTPALYKQLTAPVTGVETEKDRVPNNGTGMAPYMLSVGLYVGMLAFNLMMGMALPRKKPVSALAWFAAKMSLLFGYALVAAGIAYGAAIVFLGLNPVHPWATFGMVAVIALTFSAIVTALNLWLDKPGAFIAVVFLVIQLSGSAGTYPIQLSSDFFKAIHLYLPMTYAVDGLRESIMIGGPVWPQMSVLLAIFAGFSFVMYLFYVSRVRRYTMMPDD
jgi:putative membrane protein